MARSFAKQSGGLCAGQTTLSTAPEHQKVLRSRCHEWCPHRTDWLSILLDMRSNVIDSLINDGLRAVAQINEHFAAQMDRLPE